MKSQGVLNPDISELIARMGHGDGLAVTDRGFPLPSKGEITVADVSVGPNLPGAVDVVETILYELEIEEVIIADETEEESPQIYENFIELLEERDNKGKDIVVTKTTHPEFKDMVLGREYERGNMKGLVRTGELTPYANIILVSGVTF